LAEFREEDVFAPDEEGRKYLGSVYIETDYDALPEAPDDGRYPRRGYYKDLGYKLTELPRAPKLRHIIGPSAIGAGMSLGSGETLFWPNITAASGGYLFWMFWLGVFTQWVIDMEIERPAAVTGEGWPRTFARIHPAVAWIFCILGFFQWVWPGWASGAGKMAAYLVGWDPSNWPMIGVVLMIIIFLIEIGGPIIYNMVEKAELVMVFVIMAAALIAFFMSGAYASYGNLWASSFTGFGRIDPRVDLMTLLGGLAYAGNGGVGNLGQALWIKEKGFAMGAYQGRIENPIRVPEEELEPLHPAGFVFDVDDELQMARWKGWWRVINLEHFITFCIPLLFATSILAGISTHFASGTTKGALDMWLYDIFPNVSHGLAVMLAITIFFALFTTQAAIVDTFPRYWTEAIYDLWLRENPRWNVSKLFLIFLVLFILWGIAIILSGVGQPWFLLVLGAAISGVIMWLYNMVYTWYNTARLPSYFQPNWGRILAMWWAILFFGYFSILSMGNAWLGIPREECYAFPPSHPGMIALWIIYILSFIYVAARSVQYKLNPIDKRAGQ